MSGDKLARVLTGLTVCAVAVFAAIVSFSHIESLALAHGQPVATARLMPLSVDGLILAASLVLLTEARAHREALRLARAGLALGALATVLANVAYGARYGVVGAVISAWPAVSFIISTEILLGQMRRAGGIPSSEKASGTVAATVPEVGPATVPSALPVDVPEIAPVAVPADGVPPTPVTVPRTVTTGHAGGRASKRKQTSPERVFAPRSNGASCPRCAPSGHGRSAEPTAPASSVTSSRRSSGKHQRQL